MRRQCWRSWPPMASASRWLAASFGARDDPCADGRRVSDAAVLLATRTVHLLPRRFRADETLSHGRFFNPAGGRSSLARPKAQRARCLRPPEYRLGVGVGSSMRGRTVSDDEGGFTYRPAGGRRRVSMFVAVPVVAGCAALGTIAGV